MTEERPFEFDAERYHNCSKHQKEWGTKLIEGLDLRGDERVLDIGCGDGVLTSKMAEMVPQGSVLGIDSSRNMIERAGMISGANLRFAVMDANEMRFEREFDVIFSNAALHWVLDHRRLHDRCLEALRPGGRVRFNFAGEGNCSNFFAVARQVMQEERFHGLFLEFRWPWYMPSIDSYHDLVNQIGYSSFKVWGEVADRHFSEEELVGWIDQPSIVPFLQHIPEDKRAGFRDRVVETMLRRTREPDGSYFETFRRVNLEAQS